MLNANPDANARWNLVVSRDTDIALRQFPASQGDECKDELSHFVEEAVKSRIFDLAARAAKAENAGYSQEYIDTAIDEALTWARQ